MEGEKQGACWRGKWYTKDSDRDGAGRLWTREEGCEVPTCEQGFVDKNSLCLAVGTFRQWNRHVSLSRVAVVSREKEQTKTMGCDHKREATDHSRSLHTQIYHLISIFQKNWFSLTRKG